MRTDLEHVPAPSAGTRARGTRRRALATALVSLAGMALAPVAFAHSYSGTTAQWAKLSAKISAGMLTAFATSTGRLQTCGGQPEGGSSTDPVDVRLSGPAVPIVAGRFHLQGTTVDDWKDPFTFTVDGKVARDGREITGTITAGGDTVFAKGCTGTWNFDAVLPPRPGRAQIGHMYTARARASRTSRSTTAEGSSRTSARASASSAPAVPRSAQRSTAPPIDSIRSVSANRDASS